MVLSLRNIDANLLVALDILLQERHITRAAQRIGVTQSAMSQTLKRLRATFNDPLLVRSGSQMVTTPRADALVSPLRTTLQSLEQILTGVEGFDPSTARRNFRIACVDPYALSVLPRLFSRIACQEGQISLEVLPLRIDELWNQLRTGDLHMAIIGPWDVPADIETKAYLPEQMISVVREAHPILQQPITTKSFTSWPHIVFRLTGRGSYPIDRRLASMGFERNVIGNTPSFLGAAAILIESEIIATVPSTMANLFAERWPVELFEPPIGEPMRFNNYLAWPNFLDADPGHLWLRQQLKEIAKELPVHCPPGPLNYDCG